MNAEHNDQDSGQDIAPLLASYRDAVSRAVEADISLMQGRLRQRLRTVGQFSPLELPSDELSKTFSWRRINPNRLTPLLTRDHRAAIVLTFTIPIPSVAGIATGIFRSLRKLLTVWPRHAKQTAGSFSDQNRHPSE